MKQVNQIVKLVKERGLYPEIETVCSAPEPEVIINGKKYLLFCSNNYLGLSTNKNVVSAAIRAIEKYGLSTCSSRMMAGNNDIHEELEKKIAEFKRTEAAIVFPTGFMTNIGTIPAIFDGVYKWGKILNIDIKSEKGLVISDELNHNSIVSACSLAGVEKMVYKHRDLNSLEEILRENRDERKLIITDSVFSLDGDIAPLPGIVGLAKKYKSLIMLDEAHATGVFGENGRGIAEHFRVEEEIDIKMGTFTKVLAGFGGFVAGAKNLIDFLRITARSYIFTTAPIPAVMAGVCAAIEEIETHPELRKKLWENINYMRNGFKALGFDTMESESSIVPILIGDEKKAMQSASMLLKNGIFALCIRYYAVPLGKARIRFTVMATHTKKQIDYLLYVMEKVGKKVGII